VTSSAAAAAPTGPAPGRARSPASTAAAGRRAMAASCDAAAGGGRRAGPRVARPFRRGEAPQSRSGAPLRASRMAVGRSRPPVGPSSTASTAAKSAGSASSSERGGASPARLALVETRGPPKARQRAASPGCALTRTATPACAPVIQRGTRGVAGTIQVCGPGHEARTAARRPSGTAAQSSSPSNCASSSATGIRPRASSRCLSSSTRRPADASNGSQARPQTASVGQATTPPRRRTSTACARPGDRVMGAGATGWAPRPSERRVVGRRGVGGLARGGGLGGRLFRRRLLRGLLRRLAGGGLRRLLRRRLLRGFLRRGLPGGRLLRRSLLRGGLLAEAAARGLPGFLEQGLHFLQGQRLGVAVLGDLAVEAAVADVGAEAPVEHLDVAALEGLDDPVAGDLLLLLDQEHRALQVDGVGIVLLLQRGIGAAAARERTEAADADADLLALVLAEHAREAEQVDRLLQRDRVHALPGAQRSEARLVLGVLRGAADGRVGPVAAQAHAHRLARGRVGPQLARPGGLAAVHALGVLLDPLLERAPDLGHQRDPVLLAAADG